ncbi:50S ribosomal protein L24 [Candidatus Woesearchaeota archaeon]|nr:50S ribosomal protein L24 [Candidatus Woesearchaeota archaeon]
MKKDYVSTWKASSQPRKQRKYQYNAPMHISGKFVSANLSKELRPKYGVRSIRLRKGDKVRVLRGQYKGKSGKVERVSLKYTKVFITGIELLRKDGTKSLIPVEPSNLQITDLDTSDKKRFNSKKKDKNIKTNEKQ